MITVFGTYRNADMTEGKGPMELDKIFAVESDAQAYIDKQPGIFGRRPTEGWQNSDMSDWRVIPLYVLEHLEDGKEYERRKMLERAYSKLTSQERDAIVEHVRALVT